MSPGRSRPPRGPPFPTASNTHGRFADTWDLVLPHVCQQTLTAHHALQTPREDARHTGDGEALALPGCVHLDKPLPPASVSPSVTRG